MTFIKFVLKLDVLYVDSFANMLHSNDVLLCFFSEITRFGKQFFVSLRIIYTRFGGRRSVQHTLQSLPGFQRWRAVQYVRHLIGPKHNTKSPVSCRTYCTHRLDLHGATGGSKGEPREIHYFLIHCDVPCFFTACIEVP